MTSEAAVATGSLSQGNKGDAVMGVGGLQFRQARDGDELRLVRTPWQLGPLRLRHRIVMGSMHTGRDLVDDGGRTLAAFYRERVAGGACLIITGGLAVNEEGRGGPDYAVLTDPAVQERWRRVVGEVHEAGAFILAQLFHAGRYTVNADAVAPSPVPWRAARGVVPRELEDAGVRRTIDDFATAASISNDIGFDGVEVMGSEGYLLSQFLSPRTNLRSDQWGGSAQARARMPLAVISAVREVIPDRALVVRVSVSDLLPDSATDEELHAFALAATRSGADGLDMGIGWHESPVPTVQAIVPHAAWIGYGERLVEAVRRGGSEVPVIGTNRISDLRDAERILSRGKLDAVAMARPFLADPAIIARSFAGDFELVNSCIGCNQACIDNSLTFHPVSCLVNPRAGRELEFPAAETLPCNESYLSLDVAAVVSGDTSVASTGQGEGEPASPAVGVRTVAVVGGGPAGLTAAEDLASRGAWVTLFEERPQLGGQFELAARIPGKGDYALTVASAVARLAALGVRVVLGARPDAETLVSFDAVVLATGVHPRRPDIDGIDLPHVIDYETALRNGVPPGPVAIIGGGGIGVDIASYLTEAQEATALAAEFADRYAVSGVEQLVMPGAVVTGEVTTEGIPLGEQATGAGATKGVVPEVVMTSVIPGEAGMRREMPTELVARGTSMTGEVSPEMPPRPGSDVTVLRRSGRFGQGIGVSTRWVTLGTLKAIGVRMLSELNYRRITTEGVEIEHIDGSVELIPARTVIICAGQTEWDPLSRELDELDVRYELVGGARDASAVDAVRARVEALTAARRLLP